MVAERYAAGAHEAPDPPEGYLTKSAEWRGPRVPTMQQTPQQLSPPVLPPQLLQNNLVSPGQLALAWLLAQGPDVVPIPGTKRERYFKENMAALQVVLSPAEVQELTAVADPSKVVGERYGGVLSKVGGACRVGRGDGLPTGRVQTEAEPLAKRGGKPPAP